MRGPAATGRTGCGFAAVLLAATYPVTALADMSNADLLKRIETLEAQIRDMKTANTKTRVEVRRIREKQHAVVRSPTPIAPVTVPAMIPPDTSPAFVTANKKLQFGPITITPGGFLAAESVYRTRGISADLATPYFAIPTRNSTFANTGEFRFSARQSRAALLAEGAITPSLLAAGYAELDFFGAAQTANQVESNSYNPRIRNIYATLDATDYGLHVLAGQNWSLVTLNSKGITPRNEVAPPTIDAFLVPGFTWTRQPQIRVTKDFDRRLWLSLSAESPQTTFGGPGCTPSANGAVLGATTIGSPAVTGVSSIACQEFGSTFFNSTTGYSLNHAPDVVAKVAYEAVFGERDVHLEAFGLYRDLYDRVNYTNGVFASHDTTGYGAGFGIIAPVIPRRLDVQVSGLFGRGIGRYGTSQLPDATFSPDGSIKPIAETALLAGATLHATPSIDLYVFGGFERQNPTFFQNGAIVSSGAPNATASGFYGIGAPNVNDSGCYIEGSTACTGNTKQVYQITVGIWDKLYKGSYGEVRVGAQYSYTNRSLFPSTFNATTFHPATDDNVIFTSLRYYPFQ